MYTHWDRDIIIIIIIITDLTHQSPAAPITLNRNREYFTRSLVTYLLPDGTGLMDIASFAWPVPSFQRGVYVRIITCSISARTNSRGRLHCKLTVSYTNHPCMCDIDRGLGLV